MIITETSYIDTDTQLSLWTKMIRGARVNLVVGNFVIIILVF